MLLYREQLRWAERSVRVTLISETCTKYEKASCTRRDILANNGRVAEEPAFSPFRTSRVTMRLAFLLLALLNGRLLAQTTVIRAGRVIDPASGTVATNQYVVVENRRIVAVGPAVPVLKDARTVDLS